MPVVWNTASCDPPTPKDDADAAWRNHLIEHSGVIGLSRITEDNVEDWLWRFTFLQRTLSRDCGCLIWGDGPGKHRREYITLPILRRWVGLWTNWSNQTRPAFVKLRMQRLEQDSDAVVRGLAAQHRREEKEPVVVKPKKKRRAKA
jgi:hypothetical protein